ncbi:TetR/AcrR family transcriptional regulator [Nitriliruptoraceae bacterium ZYF776]|nr:TetR/AcrR family transcriptional regulator [Profundirhabdus halotolerans]
MPRPPRFSEDQILDAGLARVAEGGPGALTVTAVARRIGAPSGSIYHRFGSRDLLAGHLWLRTVEAFQAAWLDALDGSDEPLERARRGAAQVLTWSAANPDGARLLVRHRREDLLADGGPADLRDADRRQRERAAGALHDLARRFGGDGRQHLRRVSFACVEVPTTEVRRGLALGTLPDATSHALVDETVVALLAPLVDRRPPDGAPPPAR